MMMDGGKDARYLIMLLPFSLFHFSIDFKDKLYVAKNARYFLCGPLVL